MESFLEDNHDLTITTSCTVQNREVEEYIGIVSTNVTLGRNVGKDFMAGLRDLFGGRSRSWEKSLQDGQRQALQEIIDKAEINGADGIIGLSLEDEAVGSGTMMNIKATGTAVKFKED